MCDETGKIKIENFTIFFCADVSSLKLSKNNRNFHSVYMISLSREACLRFLI